jgi:DAK2 domain fusion protein YloV
MEGASLRSPAVAVDAEPVADPLPAASVRQWMIAFRDAVQAHAVRLNRLNVYPVPDGDTGTNMARTLEAAVADLDDVPPDDLAATLTTVSHGSLMGARGNSGVILSQILRGFAGVLQHAGEASSTSVATGLQAASTAAYEAVLKPIEGTILTVAREAATAATRVASSGHALLAVLEAARGAGQEALDRTPDLLPVLKQAGVVDAGGAGYLLMLDAGLHVVDGRPLPEPDVSGTEVDAGTSLAGFAGLAHRGEGDVSELRYEVMYFLDLADDHIDEFKRAWAGLGDSIVVVGGDGLWNCHVHTNDIGGAIEVGMANAGRPSKIRVTDLFDEVDEEHRAREAAMGAATGSAVDDTRRQLAAAGLPPVGCAVVAVCAGSGLVELFGQLGVQGVVTGGQTMNPSTAELLDAVAHVNADEVVILPNNKNIVPVAEQVGSLSDKVVRVVATRSIPEALAALVVYDPEEDAEANRAAMAEAAEAVVAGEVTRAVRAASSDAGPVSTGDYIGLRRGEGIVAVAPTVDAAAITLLDRLLTPERELLTIITGDDADRAATEAVLAWVAQQRPGVDVEVHDGGQPLYPYLFGAE